MIGSWLPWLTTHAGGGGHASAIGGTVGAITVPAGFGAGQLIVLLTSVLAVAAAVAARGLSPVPASVAALLLSLGLVALIWWYHHTFVTGEVSAGYGFYIGAAAAVAAVALSVWTLIDALGARGTAAVTGGR